MKNQKKKAQMKWQPVKPEASTSPRKEAAKRAGLYRTLSEYAQAQHDLASSPVSSEKYASVLATERRAESSPLHVKGTAGGSINSGDVSPLYKTPEFSPKGGSPTKDNGTAVKNKMTDFSAGGSITYEFLLSLVAGAVDKTESVRKLQKDLQSSKEEIEKLKERLLFLEHEVSKSDGAPAKGSVVSQLPP